MRPTMVMRASCDGLDVENARVQVVAGIRRIGDRRNDILVNSLMSTFSGSRVFDVGMRSMGARAAL